MDFKTFAQERGLEQGVFPHALFGLSVLKKIKVVIWALVSIITIRFGLRFLPDPLPYDDSKAVEIDLIGSFNMFNWAQDIYGSLKSLEAFLGTLSFYVFLLGLLLSLIYMVNIVKRWRYYERDCLKNDLRSLSLKSSIIRTIDLKRQIRAAEAKSSNSNSQQTDTYNPELEALRVMKNMQVTVNTRESLTTSSIIRRYQVVFETPFNQDEFSVLDQKTKDFPSILNRLVGGEVKFGDRILTSDMRQFIMYGHAIVPDKYARDETIIEDNEVYETSFPLSLLKDVSSIEKSRREQAMIWANQSATVLDSLLVSSGYSVTRMGQTVGASSALLTYSLPMSLNLDNFDSLGKKIDNAFKMEGTTCSVVSGDLQIVLPIPSELRPPINVPSMYRKVFGSDGQEI